MSDEAQGGRCAEGVLTYVEVLKTAATKEARTKDLAEEKFCQTRRKAADALKAYLRTSKC